MVSNPPDHDPAGPSGAAAAPGWQGHHGAPSGGPFPDRVLARYTRRGSSPGQPSPPGRATGRLALFLGVLALVTSIFIIGGVVGVAAIVAGMRARAHARRSLADADIDGRARGMGWSRGWGAAGAGTGGGTGTAGLALGALSLLIAFTVASGMWVFYERHGDDLHDYQECRRGARSVQEREDCSRRFSDAVRTDPTSNG